MRYAITCIVGLIDNSSVYIGGDSAATADTRQAVRGDPKVFLRPEGCIIGCTSSFYMRDILMECALPAPPDDPSSLESFMRREFISAVRAAFTAAGFTGRDDLGAEIGGTFLVGVRGRLFQIGDDYQLGWMPVPYSAVGCGDDLAMSAMKSLLISSPTMRPENMIQRALENAAEYSAGVRPPFIILSLPARAPDAPNNAGAQGDDGDQETMTDIAQRNAADRTASPPEVQAGRQGPGVAHRAFNIHAPPKTADAQTRTVEAVISTGAAVRRCDYWSGDSYDKVLVISEEAILLDRLNAGAPVLDSHNRWSIDGVLGSVVQGSVRIENGELVGSLQFSAREDRAGIWQDVQAGHIADVSVGYFIHKKESDETTSPQTVRITRWEPFEVLVVALGAAAAAGFRSQPHSVHTTTPALSDDARSHAVADRTPAAGDTPAHPRAGASQDIGTRSVSQEEPPATPPPAMPPAAERALAEDPKTFARTLADTPTYRAFGQMALDMATVGASVAEIRAAVLATAAQRSGVHPTRSQVEVPRGGLDANQTRIDALAGAILHRFDATRYKLAEAAREYRGLKLIDLAREFAEAHGLRCRGQHPLEIARRALTTSDFPALLSNVVNRTLRDAYEMEPLTFQPFCRQTTASDFKEKHQLQITGTPDLLPLNEDGEYEYATLAEGKETYKLTTYERMIQITWQVIVNDDLGAFTRVPWMFGNAAARRQNDTVWAIVTTNPKMMTDNKELFHADHGNLAAPGTLLSIDSLAKGRAAMVLQTEHKSKSMLGLTPFFVLVPEILRGTAEQLVYGTYMPTAPDKASLPFVRQLNVISDGRLDRASALAWYLATSPSRYDTIEYCYFEGAEGVYIEPFEELKYDGMTIKARLDFTAKAIGWQGLYKNSGAAPS